MTENMPKSIMPIGDTPAGYAPEYLPDGQVWLTKNGERLRLLRDYKEFAVAAHMHGAYATPRTMNDHRVPVQEAPFGWEGAAPQYEPPAYASPAYVIAFRIGWPCIEISISVDNLLWRLWNVVKDTRKHAYLIRQFDPVSSWFEHWIDPKLVTEIKGRRYIKRRDAIRETARLSSLIERT